MGNSFSSSVNGDLVEAVVPFMGESITDGTLARFLKSVLSSGHLNLVTVEVDEPIAQVKTDKVTIDVASPEAGIIQEEGDTVEPGTKIALISKAGEGSEGVTHAVPSEEAPLPPPPPPPREKEHAEKQIAKAETTSIKQVVKQPSLSPPRTRASESCFL